MRGAVIIFSYNNLGGATKRVYDYLYDEIINNRFTPGTALSELEIAKRLSTSRSPVREAMMVLESEGLIRRYPGRACFVTEISTQDINEIFTLRILLEVAALRQSYNVIDVHSLLALEKDLSILTAAHDPESYFATDRKLHDLITGGCGNMRLVLILRTLNGQIEQFRRISAKQPKRLKESRQEHWEIVSALLKKDLESACSLLENHIRNVQSSTLNVYIQMGLNDVGSQPF